MRPKIDQMSYTDWKAVQAIWRMERWHAIVSWLFQMHDTLDEWNKRKEEWR